jgi:phenylpropionate dioxygenase-like ring-hydroxylating dioxygenase large terminal subunit
VDPQTERAILADLESARAAGGQPFVEGEHGSGRVPGDVYTDEQRYRAEIERIFFRSWVPVARASELGEPGSFVARSVERAGVLVTRDDAGVIRAFHNTCIHRGAAIASADGCAQRLTCPYHAWSYSLDGRLESVPDPASLPPSFDLSKARLGEIGAAVRWGYVFVDVGGRAAPIDAFLGPDLADEFTNFRLDALEHKGRVARDGDFDWKASVENYIEPYHVPSVHRRSIHPLIQTKHAAMACFGDHSRMVIPLRAPQLYEGDGGGKPFAPMLPGLNELQRTTTLVYLVWPSLIVNFNPNHVVTFHVLPLGPGRTHVSLDVYGPPTNGALEAEFWERLRAGYVDFVDEDFHVVAAVQRGLGGPFKPDLTLTHYERRLRHFRARVDAWLART